MSNLPLIWGAIILFCVLMYVVLDGFTLGIGMLLVFLKPADRNLATSVVLPTWDGNQTWLVLGMASLYGAFPGAFSLLLPHFYLPLIFMVLLLLGRGVGFEFRLKDAAHRHYWDVLVIGCSALIAFIQGMLVGNMAEGIGSREHFISLFSLATGCGVVVAYLLLGSTRLLLKSDGPIHKRMRRLSLLASILFVFVIIGVSIWTPFVHPHIYSLWFSGSHWENLIFLPIITALLVGSLWLSIYAKMHVLPYWFSVLLVLAPYVGFVVNLYPYAVPYSLTYSAAAAPTSTLIFIAVGAFIMIPFLLLYTGYAYYIFRGKVKDELKY